MNDMKKHLRYKISIFVLSTFLLSLSAPSLFAQNDKTKNTTVGSFKVELPINWKPFSANEFTALRQQYMEQSKEIYRQFSGSDDPSKSVDVAAFHISNDGGTLIIVSFSVPPQSDLIALLKSQVKNKMDWGVREGHIHKYLGLVTIDKENFTGFYTKAIGKGGNIQVSGGLEHKNIKNTMIQLTLLCPKAWDEVKATHVLSSILKTLTVDKK